MLPLREVEDVFQAMMDLPEHQRAAYLDQRCGPESDLRHEVECLANLLPGAETFIGSKAVQASTWTGGKARVGAYRLERKIGAGGMGTVYLASRADGQFRQRVAIKLVRVGMDSEWAIERFRYERQTLATLNHPNIARLLDGGSTDEGLPYLVMEYIEGEPITTYCCRRKLSEEARLRLCLGVCEAVSYAHRNLVVHRDIKPANILVTADGTPKLLDFGISKLVADDPNPATHTAVRLMTPEYASPEQIRGHAVTTATDVYSLGVVLHEVLTGVRPEQQGENTLTPDIGKVIAKTTHPDADRRYASVDQFAEDIRRYLAGHPVTARPDSFAYRASKFIGRHKGAMVAVALIACALLAGAAATAWQARKVIEQVDRTERLFIRLRKLANTFLFDFHDRIEQLKDLSEARSLVLATGMEYIDGLASDAGADPTLRRELARAYEKLGDLYGFQHHTAMGRSAEALASYRKAIALLDPMYRDGSIDSEATLLLSRCNCSLGSIIERSEQRQDTARGYYRNCLDVAWAAARGQMDQIRYVGLLNRAYHHLGDAELRAGNRDLSIEYYRTIGRILEDHRGALGTKGLVWLADNKRRIGVWQARGGDDSAALQSFRSSLDLVNQRTDQPFSVAEGREILAVYMALAGHRAACIEIPGLASGMSSHARRLKQAFPNHPLVSADCSRAEELLLKFRSCP